MAQPLKLVNPRKLFPIINDTACREWCGPSVICALTNHPMSIVRRVIKDIRETNGSRAALMGMQSSELRETLGAFGFTMDPRCIRYDRENAPTVARWLRKHRNREGTYILIITYRRWVTGHWVIVRGNKFADSHTDGPVNLKESPHRRKRVKRTYRVWQIGKRRKTIAPINFKL